MNQKNIPTVFVIFGATGDLMAKKIAPALFHLYRKNKLPKLFKVIGVARRKLSIEAFHDHVTKILRTHEHFKNGKDIAGRFLNFFSYHKGRFENLGDYKSLAKDLGMIDDEWKVCSNKLFYLAVPPPFYETIFGNLAASGLTIPCGPDEGWTRVIVEKPFGKDAKTAEKLELLLAKLFKEEQIYRIDHYLAKEMLQNILSFRFSNNLLEESWNNKFIEKIEIRLLEKAGVEGRGGFYDGLGALRDVGQNHLLQMLALVTMEHPRDLNADTVRAKRAALLETLKEPDREEIKSHTFRAQYEGYRKTEGVSPNSKTETYFRVRAYFDSSRWQGVPVFLESGKKMKTQTKEIVVTFKHVSPCLCPPNIKKHYQNKVIFSLEPEEAIKIHFLAKKPGLEMGIEDRTFDFSYREKEGVGQYIEEYEKLLLDCIEGNQLLFLDTKEVMAMWKYTDPIICAWDEDLVPLTTYKPNTGIIREQRTKNEERRMRREVGVVGLGKMGTNIARQLIEKGWRVVGYNRTRSVTRELSKEGLVSVATLQDLVKKLKPPRVIWLMVPQGAPVDEMIAGLIPYLQKGDIVIDAGNSFYKDTVKRGKKLEVRGLKFLDVGVSGGPGGARRGASLMVGGELKLYEYLLPLFIDISVPQGVEFFEGIGAGHFVKMVHNGIEYGMMQAIAEGFSILKKAKYKLDLKKVAEVYNHGSVVESRLTKWLSEGFQIYREDLEKVTGSVPRGGEGDWTVEAAEELGIKAKIIEEAVKFRAESEKKPNYMGKILNTMRNQFGGHSIK
ncbi:glucose-6-phosphate dehydrogenase [Candidatus Roizmanbacteria bacterium]|nr:glucose-6-phosphate dehydrogenase [Candidatus Roizmanbacteria bacterium]